MTSLKALKVDAGRRKIVKRCEVRTCHRNRSGAHQLQMTGQLLGLLSLPVLFRCSRRDLKHRLTGNIRADSTACGTARQ